MNKHASVTHNFGNRPPAVLPAVVGVHRITQRPPRLARTRCSLAWTWALEWHAAYAGPLRVEGLAVPLAREPGTVHLYAPRAVYWEDTRSAKMPLTETYIVFDGRDCGLEALIDAPSRFARFHDPSAKAGALIEEAADGCAAQGDQAFWHVQSLLASTLHLLATAERLDAFNRRIRVEPENAPDTFAAKAERFMKANLAEKITLSRIAAHMHTSPSSLSHLFQLETGVPPKRRMRQLRIDQAKILVLRGEKLKAVAESVGFGDEFQFSKAFKAITGVSPRAFRDRSSS
jgi:AraC-like DNA-binding protein